MDPRRSLGWLSRYAERAADGDDLLPPDGAGRLRARMQRRHGISERQADILLALVGASKPRRTYVESGRWAEVCAAWQEHGGPPVPDSPVQAPSSPPSAPSSPPSTGVSAEYTDEGVRVVANACRLRSLDAVLEACSVDLDLWAVEAHTIKPYSQAQKGPDGEPVVVHLFSHTVRLVRRVLPRQEAPTRIEVVPMPEPAPREDGARPILCVPDAQIGYRWDRGQLVPMHDRRALDLAVQLARVSQPSRIVHLGDMLDLAPASTKYARPAELMQTTAAALAEWGWWLGQFAAAVPGARQDWLEGNHEARWQKALVEKLPEHATLPGMRIEAQLDLDSVRCDYRGPYGSEAIWLSPLHRAGHTFGLKSGGGATAAHVVRLADVSSVYGHDHKRELAVRTVHGPNGPREVVAWSPGCLCRVDGTVPGLDGSPDWQQGLGLWWFNGDEQDVDLVGIERGRMRYGGLVYRGEDPSSVIAEATGYPI